MKRVLIIGPCGAGKSTLAKKLGRKLDLPVVHLDSYFHSHGWQSRLNDEWESILKKLIKKDKWIMDGNYRESLEARVKRADTIVFLDFNRFLSLYITYKRMLIGNRIDNIPELEEKFDFKLAKAILFRHPRKRKFVTLSILKKLPKDKKLYVLKTRKEVEEFLKGI